MNSNGRNKLFVADSTPLGQDYRLGAAMANPETARLQVQKSNQLASEISTLINVRHHTQMMDIAAEREYGNKKTSRRFELNPRFHLLAELSEVLKRGAFPRYEYYPGEFDMVRLLDANDYDKRRAAEYYYARSTELSALDATITVMIEGYSKALAEIIDNYRFDIHGKPCNMSDLLFRELVDQTHRRTRAYVEAGLQLNTIEDPELISEVSGCSEALELLYRAYARIEDIESGLAGYVPFSDELYFSPSEIPMRSERAVDVFMAGYEQQVNSDFSDFFSGFDQNAVGHLDYMGNFMLQIKKCLSEVRTEHGQGSSAHFDYLRMRDADAHVMMTVDAINDIRKKGNFLAALAYCIELAWSKAPEVQTATSWIIYKNNAAYLLQCAMEGWITTSMPDTEPLMRDDSLLSEIFPINPDPSDVFSGVLAVFEHAKRVMIKMESEHEKGHLPMWNFKRREWWDGQLIEKGGNKDGSNLRFMVQDAYEMSDEMEKAKRSNLHSAMSSY